MAFPPHHREEQKERLQGDPQSHKGDGRKWLSVNNRERVSSETMA